MLVPRTHPGSSGLDYARRAAGVSQGLNRLPTAATLSRTGATTRAGLMDWSGTILRPKLLAVALACTGAAARTGLVDRPRAVLRPGYLAVALAPLLSRALTLVRILLPVLTEGGWNKREG
jgi:hypothetical protein